VHIYYTYGMWEPQITTKNAICKIIPFQKRPLSLLVFFKTGIREANNTKRSAEGESPLQVFRLMSEEFLLVSKSGFKEPVRIAKQASSHCNEISRPALQHILTQIRGGKHPHRNCRKSQGFFNRLGKGNLIPGIYREHNRYDTTC